MTDAKLYKSEQKYCNTAARKKLQKFRNLIIFVLLSKADKTETFFMNIMRIGYSYTATTITFLVFH